MAVSMKIRKLSALFLKQNKICLYNNVRTLVGPPIPGRDPESCLDEVPQTKEELERTCKKFGVHPNEYKPFDRKDWRTVYGDYPDIPMQGAAARDPYYPWDFPEMRRNYNEIMHIHFDVLTEDRCDKEGIKTYLNETKAKLFFIFLLTFLTGLSALLDYVPRVPAVIEKQFPEDGGVHYTFPSSH